MGESITIQEKINKMTEYYEKFLELVKDISYNDYIKDYVKQMASDKLIELIIDTAISINNMILKKEKKDTSPNYYNSFINLAEAGIIDMDFAIKIAPSTGLRNVLVHQYEEVDDKQVYESFKDIEVYYKEYIELIKKYIGF